MSDNSEQSVPKLGDFGLSKILGPEEKVIDSLGTLGYSAPEIVTSQPFDLKCDSWSYGCVLYGLFSGRLPFYADSREETRELTISGKLAFDYPGF
jgi:NIMA (never in mitosis gene a)-related kinase